MAVLTDFTTYADIRTILGVSKDELSDEDLALETYLFGLESALDEVGASLITDYQAASAAVVAVTATELQTKLYRATRMYSALQVGLKVSYSLAMRAEKAISDGKASSSRFTDNPIKQTQEALQGLVAAATDVLVTAYATLNGETVPTKSIPSFLSVVTPAVDPVTG